MNKNKKNVTKSELISDTTKNIGYEFKECDVKNIVDSFIKLICQEIKNGNDVKIEGLGTFTTYTRKSYIGKNIRTGEVEEIKETKYISFKPSSKMKG